MSDPMVTRLRALPQRTVDGARGLIDGALDRVFDEPYDVRSAAEYERLVVEGPTGGGPGATATGLGAFVAAATPLAQRALRTASASSKVSAKIPLPSTKMVRVGIASIPLAMRLTNTSRRGVRELQLLASYVMAQLRAAGVTPERSFVRALTTSIYVDPARRPPLGPGSSSRAAGAISRQWVLRAIGGDGEESIRARVHRQVAALDRADLAGLSAAWSRGDVIDL